MKIEKEETVKVTDTKDWYSWVNIMPPPPNDFHVTGEVLVSNPGVQAILTPKVPQGINPSILFLELILIQRSGFWPAVETWVPARYDKIVSGLPYSSVTIFSDGEAIAEVSVDTVS